MAFASRSQNTRSHFVGVLLRAFGLVFTFFLISTQSTFGQKEAISKPASGPMNVEQRQSDALFASYKFRDGEILPTLRVHYVTLGHPHKNKRGAVDNAVLVLHWTNANGNALLTPEFQRALFTPESPIDATRFYVIIPDDVGHGGSSKPSDGLRATFPHYGYADMVDIQHKLVAESLGIAHLHAIVGMSMGCMNAWQWAEAYPDAMDGIMPIACFPAPISGRNLLWRRMLIDGIESDPLWENGSYQKQPPSGAAGLVLARMMIDGVPALQQEVRFPEAADGFIRGIKARAGSADTNDLLYAFESSRDFNAEPGLSLIKSKVFALNFADDEFYRDSLQILEADVQQVRRGKLSVRPITAGSAGHFSMSHPDLWRDYVATFMSWIGTD
jgi:homoserine O-acetyltransferase/O-succinyltransferase